MTLLSLLSSLLLLALGVVANPVVINRSLVTLPLAKKYNFTSINNLLEHDQARARALKSRAFGKGGVPDTGINEPITDQAVTYTASVGVGSPPTYYDLLVDTGSSNTWIGSGNKKYVKTSTSVQTGDSVYVSYGKGYFYGTEFYDTVTLTPQLVIQGQSIGVALESDAFDNYNGILGIGPTDLTIGTLNPDTQSSVSTVTDNLHNRGTIPAYEIGIFFQPINATSPGNGEITWGGADSSKYTGQIKFTPITNIFPASAYWGINQSIRYGVSTVILQSTAGIVDTGTTLILLATDAFNRYSSATGAVPDDNTSLLRITPAQFSALQGLVFTINGVLYTLTPNAQLWPRSLNTQIGGTAGSIYLIVGDLGSASGEGLDFINGYAFLERFYSVYDTANQQVGLATTPYTLATTN
ncbi:aspartic peptidase A1 [Laccaria bicolor S238N-H82]|uniref:Aspartic peptidase A1 n=1 Tax=Laccaria bicolor (strain S238N-H82 / ATCC MYA-4686) TaxID=486041 RepID=B0DVH0_LACBS|nr:aspartic peptidase A1 [Laccaria bicolor S238N-H82]EDR01383.1 aspartic peptidase A1 [Laccaria bicolor S238N-H82]|eukprot:XP_001887928.1 aspartic peptidase A1 [Laccaria bicolor S238N-H82]